MRGSFYWHRDLSIGDRTSFLYKGQGCLSLRRKIISRGLPIQFEVKLLFSSFQVSSYHPDPFQVKRVNPQQVHASNPQQILPHQTNVATNRLEAQQKPTKAEQQTSQQQITKAFQVGGQISNCLLRCLKIQTKS